MTITSEQSIHNSMHDIIMDPPDTSSQLELILAKLTVLESLPSKVESLEKLLLASNARADSLQQQLTVKDKIICDLQAKTNSLEQYNRGWSIRLNNIPLPDHDQTDTYTVMKTVFDTDESIPHHENLTNCEFSPLNPAGVLT